MKLNKQHFYSVFCILVLFFSLHAKSQSLIKGKVTDDQGIGLPGVTVLLKNSGKGVATNMEGEFSIQARIGDRLVISAVSFESEDILIDQRSTYNIQLKSAVSELEQVVVVGYGSSKKKDLTGAISTVTAEELSERKSVQVSDALQGAVAGVTVTRNGDAPGSGSTIRFRGITTIGDNNPLIIVDGVPNTNIDNINPDDIESITALKDAASASIYGSRAAAGVLLITTKRAKAGQASLSYSYDYGNIRPTQTPTYVDAVRYMQLFNEFSKNDGGASPFPQATIDSYSANNVSNPDVYPNTNWQDLILKESANRENHNLSFSLGSEKVRTRASIGYANTGGLYDNRFNKRYNAIINNDFDITNKLNANFDVSLVRSENQDINNTFQQTPIYDARLMPAIFPAVYQDGRLAPGKDGRNIYAQIKEGGYDRAINSRVVGRMAINFKPVDGLSITGQVAPSYVFSRNSDFSKVISFTDPVDASKIINVNQANTSLSEERPYSYVFNGQFLVNYLKSFNQVHNVEGLLGYEDNYNYSEYLSASRGSFALADYPYLDNGLLTLRDNNGGASEFALRSYFGRLKYNFKSKYLLQVNGRYDGSSKFNNDRRWAFFPSVSGGWVVTEENFLKSFTPLTFLKLRASWGQAGNERIGNYPYQANISFGNALFYSNGIVTPQTSGSQVAYAVRDISWETQQTTNIGLDASFLDNRLSVAADIYQKKTKDILLQLDIPNYLGYNNPYQNAGIVSAKGWELTTNWTDNINSVRYNIGFNIADAKTNIDDLKGTQQLGDQANIEGGEFNSWYGYRSTGLYQNQADVDNSPKLNNNVKPGDVKYVDIDGDGKISSDNDKVLLGGSLPRYTFGINGRANYKNFDFSFVAQGVLKDLSRLNSVYVRPFLENFGNVPALIDGNFWSSNNTEAQNLSAQYPRLSRVSDGTNYQMSDYWLIDGKYLRVKNITLGYNVKSTSLSKFNIKGLRVYLAANDILTFSKFPKGADPETEAFSYPIVKTLLAGINLKF